MKTILKRVGSAVRYNKDLKCFNAYDVRGKLGEQLNEEVVYLIGRAIAQTLNVKTVAVGFDARKSSPSLSKTLAKGICDAGATVLNIGQAGTEEVYSAVVDFNACAGIVVTASHNPIDYNGLKIVKSGSKPLSKDEFSQIKYLAEKGDFNVCDFCGSISDVSDKARNVYLEKIIKFIDIKKLKPIKIVINSGNGVAGPTIDRLKKKLEDKGVKTNFVYVHHDPDSSFPNGIPNPLLKDNRSSTSSAIIRENADFGVAFDGDFDRCFLFDHYGNFIPGEYVVGLLSEIFLNKEKGATIIHDPRVIWNTQEVVKTLGGKAVMSKTGHSYVKSAMRNAGAVYGGEISAHHYFRDFAYCDSGMIPWLLIWELVCQKEIQLVDLISGRKKRFPSSGEINFAVPNAENSLEIVKRSYLASAKLVEYTDGLSMSFNKWRFNLRMSNTEPLVRLNVETLGDEILLRKKDRRIEEYHC